MEVDSGAAGAAGGGWNGYVGWAVDWTQELPEDCGGYVAEDGAVTASEHRGHEAAMEAQAAVADGVDAAVDAVELATLDSPRDAVLAHPKPSKLHNSDHTVLPGRNVGDR